MLAVRPRRFQLRNQFRIRYGEQLPVLLPVGSQLHVCASQPPPHTNMKVSTVVICILAAMTSQLVNAAPTVVSLILIS